MSIPKSSLLSTAMAAVFAIPFAAMPALAQENQSKDAGQASDQQDSSAANSTTAGNQQQADSLVATVGKKEIRGSDVMTVIGLLPPQLQSQPPQMLVPIALEQLILRELILQEAQAQNFAEDPEVIALVEDSAQTAEEDAMVQVWLDREMANAVSDEAVQNVYDQAKAQSQEELPPLEEVRPQIEQSLRQQAMQEVRMQLREGADIVLYDPTGRPMEQDGAAQPESNQASSDGTGDSGSGDNGQSSSD